MGLVGELVLVIADPEFLEQVLDTGLGHHGCGQHHHVRLDLHRGAGKGVRTLHDELVPCPVNPGHTATQVDRAVLLDGPAHELVVALARGTDVHVEDVSCAVVHLVLVKHGVLCRVHAAGLGAEENPLGGVAAPDTFQERYNLGLLAVRRPEDLPLGGPGGRGEPFELEPVDDVRVRTVAVLPVTEAFGIRALLFHGVEIVTRGNDDAAHVLFHELVRLFEVHRIRGADLLAGLALALFVKDAVVPVDDRAGRHGLGKGDVDGRTVLQAPVELGGDLLGRALELTLTAARALVHVNRAGLLPDRNPEISHEAVDLFHLGVSVELDVGMAAAVHHLGREDAL